MFLCLVRFPDSKVSKKQILQKGEYFLVGRNATYAVPFIVYNLGLDTTGV